MKKTLTLLFGAFVLNMPIFAQTSLNLSQELSFDNGTGLNLASKYLMSMHLATATDYIIVRSGIPFVENNGMTSVSLNYWGYLDSWETVVGWYVYQGKFHVTNAYTNGISLHDHVKMFVENGKICIAIPANAFSQYGTLTVNKNVGGIVFSAGWAKGWSISGIEKPGLLYQKTVPISVKQDKNFAETNLVFSANRSHNLLGKNVSFMNGSMGLGIAAPLDRLHINGGNLVIQNTSPVTLNGQTTQTASPKILFKGTTDVGYVSGRNDATYSGIEIGPKLNVGSSTCKAATLNVGTSTGSTQAAHFDGDAEVVGNVLVKNKLVVGADNPALIGNYRMVVDGKLGAREIEVKTEAWADYVFDKNYPLMDLNQVEEYIECNGHLPNIPSAETIVKNGISLGEMSRLQQEKIEELTLYSIQQQKQIQLLTEKVEALSNAISQ